MASVIQHTYPRKYRSKTLDEYIGTDAKTKLKQWLKDESHFPQVIGITGPPGTGKTTLARLIAKEMQCTDRQNGCACGKCMNCLTIEDDLIDAEYGQRTLGITELDVGVEGGKDRIEQLSAEVQSAPPFGYNYNIFILDECHMLTKAAQNALLKILEDIPPTSIIILCTTDPDRLLETVKDRCQLRIYTKPADMQELVARMKTIAELEKLRVSEDALKVIAQSCGRNPRKSLTLLENVAMNYNHEVTVANVLKECKKTGIDIYERFLKGTESQDPIASTLAICSVLENEGTSYPDFLDGFTSFVINCISIKYGIQLETQTQDLLFAAKRLFSGYTIGDMDCILQILEYTAKMMHTGENSEKLAILLMAMRLSKVKLLSAGLQFVEHDSVVETERGADKAVAALKATQPAPTKPLNVNENLLATVFGQQVKEISSGPNINIAVEDPDVLTPKQEEQQARAEDANVLTEEQLREMFTPRT